MNLQYYIWSNNDIAFSVKCMYTLIHDFGTTLWMSRRNLVFWWEYGHQTVDIQQHSKLGKRVCTTIKDGSVPVFSFTTQSRNICLKSHISPWALADVFLYWVCNITDIVHDYNTHIRPELEETQASKLSEPRLQIYHISFSYLFTVLQTVFVGDRVHAKLSKAWAQNVWQSIIKKLTNKYLQTSISSFSMLSWRSTRTNSQIKVLSYLWHPWQIKFTFKTNIMWWHRSFSFWRIPDKMNQFEFFCRRKTWVPFHVHMYLRIQNLFTTNGDIQSTIPRLAEPIAE